MIKALIFDFDGLILDTESPELRAWQEIFAEHGHELNLDLWADLVGRPRGYFDMYARLLGAALVARRRKGQKMNPAMLIGSRPTLSEILKKGNL